MIQEMDQIQPLQERNDAFTQKLAELDAPLAELDRARRQRQFLPQPSSDQVLTGLSELLHIQAEIQQLCPEPLPESPERLSALLERQREALSAQRRYWDATVFFLHLTSPDPELRSVLEACQREVPQADSLPPEELESALGKYILFQQAFAETDPQKKFRLVLQVASAFETRIAEGLQFDKLTAASVPTSEPPAPDTEPPAPAEEDTWCALEIGDPSALLVSFPDSALHVQKGSSDREFGAKVFEREMSKYDRVPKRCALMLARDFGLVTPELAATQFQEDAEAIRTACEKLLSGGYLIQCRLEGVGEFYTLSPKGECIFASEKACRFLGTSRRKTDSGDLPMELTADAALNRLLFLRAIQWASARFPEAVKRHRWCLRSRAFSLLVPELGAEKGQTLCLLGGAGHTLEAFEDFLGMLKDLDQTLDLILVIGYDLPHAKALAAWLHTRCASSRGDVPVWYMEADGEECYTPDGQPGDLSFLRKEAAADAEPETSPVEPETSPVEPEGQSTEHETPPAEPEDRSVEPETLPAEPEARPAEPETPSTEKAKPALTPEMREQFRENLLAMLAQKKFYCATAYLSTLSRLDPAYRVFSRKLAYALHDPLAECNYSSERVFQVYFSDNTDVPDGLVLSAVLRNFFLNQCGYDYQLDQLWDAVAKLPVLENNAALNQALYKLKEFKSEYHRGVDSYADYRQKKREAFEQALISIQNEARDLYQSLVASRVKEQASQKRFLETKKLIFSPKSDLAECLDAVQSDNRDLLEFMQVFLAREYIRSGEPVAEENIDPNKVESALERAWDEAGNAVRLVKRSSDLMGRLRTNLLKQILRVVTVLCRYVSTLSANTVDEHDPGLNAYKRIRTPLLQDIASAAAWLEDHPAQAAEEEAGQTILLATLDELRARLDGSFEEEAVRYFYLPFLQGNQVLLDEDYLPALDDVSEAPGLTARERIEAHFTAPELSLEERLEQIIHTENTWGDDYGSARLILKYFHAHPHLVKDKSLLELDGERDVGFADPKAFLEKEHSDFVEFMELAQSYGQIDNAEGDQKESMLQIVNVWCDWTAQTGNFGFFHKILSALRRKIEEDAKVREQDLTASLAVYQAKNPAWEQKDAVRNAILEIQARIRDQNYTAAEDLLNRLNTNDLDTELTVIPTDYLLEFLREYSVNAARAGSAGTNLQVNLAREHNKDAKGARRLIENWPKGSGATPAKIKELLEGLGFAVREVQAAAPIQGKDHYLVTLSRGTDGRRSVYKHPVAVFGSEAETKGFRVVNIFGRMDAVRLIDTFREIGDAKNTLILLDYALTLADRRELARRSKTEFHEKTFAVLDRVALVYLANHYSETAVNRMLMAVIMPFAACKLYQPNSGQDMPPELFIGRKTELEKIKAVGGVNIVYGGRQLGKTALLRKAKKDVDHDENGDRAVWVDVKGKNYEEAARKISAALYDEGILKTEHITGDWDELARDIKKRLLDKEDPIPYFLLLIDEADAFIESCETVRFHPFDALEDIQGIGAGRFKFVVAGLHNLVRFKREKALSDNIGLTHLSSLTVTPFKYKEARELLEVPLSYLGFRFPDDAETARLVSTIFTTANYFPGLLQLYCSKLIEALQRNYAGYSEADTPPYVVKEALIKKVLADESFQEQIKEKFDITVKVDKSQDDYYYLVALLGAYHIHTASHQEGFDPDDMIAIARDYEIGKLARLPRESVEALMEEMQELNILTRMGDTRLGDACPGGGRYRFARFSFLQMMGSPSEVEDKILEYAEQAAGQEG